MPENDTLSCTLVTPTGEVFTEPASYVNIPAHDGLLGVQKNRAALLVELGQGTLTVTRPDGAEVTKQIEGGFAQVKDNKVTVLSDKAE